MPTAINKVKQQLAAGAIPLGVVCRTLSPVVVELVGMAGFDFAWLDMEHSTADFGLIEHLCRAADAVGIESLVRIPDQSPSSVLRALEAGAAIVNVPQVNTRAQAEAAIRAGKFAPKGERGLTPSSRGMHYGFVADGKDPFAAANERVFVMVQIETAEGVRNAQEICSIPHLDAVFIGMADLSQSFGVPGKADDPRVIDAAHKVLGILRERAVLDHCRCSHALLRSRCPDVRQSFAGKTEVIRISPVSIGRKDNEVTYGDLSVA